MRRLFSTHRLARAPRPLTCRLPRVIYRSVLLQTSWLCTRHDYRAKVADLDVNRRCYCHFHKNKCHFGDSRRVGAGGSLCFV